MARAHVLGLDIGTTGTKALLLDDGGRVRATATAGHAISMPRPGWSEQHPEDWWTSARAATREVLRRAGESRGGPRRGGRVRGGDIAGVGVAGQMHGSVFLDRGGNVLRPALLWNDQRTAAECVEIDRRAGGRAELLRLVNNSAFTGYQAPKTLWLRNHEPRVFRRLRLVLLPKDFITLRLTGVAATDVGDASGTLLLDIARRDWCTELMQRLDLDRGLFPPVHESCAVVGEVSAAAARALGLRAGTPVVAGTGDQPAAALGTGVVRPGLVSATLGTSGVMFAYSAAPVPNPTGLLQSFCHAVPGAWCVFGCMLAAGGSLQWAREVWYADRLARARSAAARDAIYEAMLQEAANAAADGRLLFHPYLSGERCPMAHPHARGALIGLDRSHTRGAIVRAVVEGITCGMAAQLGLMRDHGVPVREIRLAGGGARNAWWRQLQADAYGMPCKAMRSEQGSALGAALLAGVGAGVFRDVPSASARVAQTAATYKSHPARTRHYQSLVERARRLYSLLEPEYLTAF